MKLARHPLPLIAFCAALVLAPAARADTPQRITLADAIRMALAQQPQAAIARSQADVAKEQVTQANAKFLPTVTPQVTLRDERQTSGTDAPLVSPLGRTIIGQGGRTSIALNENLLDSGQRVATRDQAKSSYRSALDSLADTRQSIVLNVTVTYYEVLRNRDLIKVSQSQLDRATTVLNLTQGQIDAGTSPRKDAFQARADQASAQLAVRQSTDRAATALIQLRTAIGLPPTTQIDPAPIAMGDGLPSLPANTDALPLAAYLRLAGEQRPDLAARIADADAARLGVRLARINAGVQVGASYQYTYTPSSAFYDDGVDSLLMVTATYPLFDGGASRSAIRGAQAQQAGAEGQIAATRLAISSDVEQGYVQRDQAIEEARLAKIAVEAAQVNFNAVTEARKEGIGNVVDIAQAQLTLTQAQSQYVSAVYDYYEADARLARAIGAILK